MAITLNDNIKSNSGKPLDAKYAKFQSGITQAYSSISEANAAILQAYRHVGLTVLILESGEHVEYWYKNGVTDLDLVLKKSSFDSFTVNTVAELRNLKGKSNVKASVLGYYEIGDGGEGSYYWDSTSTLADNGGSVIQVTGVSTGRWVAIFKDNIINVARFGIVGNGTDESTKIQTLFNNLEEDSIIMWNNKEYIFYQTSIPKNKKSLTFIFNNTTWKYPNKTSPEYWDRFNTVTGRDNFQLRLDNIPKVTFTGSLILDGNERNGNTFGASGEPVLYTGQGLAAAIKVDCGNIGKIGEETHSKLGNSVWIITSQGFTINQTTGSYTNGRITFNRNSYFHYRVRFTATIRSGSIWFNNQSTISNPKTTSGEYDYIIASDGLGTATTNTFYFFGIAGTDADITNIVVEKINPEFGDTFFKTEGSFTIKDHGFCPINLTCADNTSTIANTMASYNLIDLNGWTWDETPVGGTQCTGYFNTIKLRNFKLVDTFGKTFDENNFVEEGARGFTINSTQTIRPNTFCNQLFIEDIYSKRTWLPLIISAKEVYIKNVFSEKWGTFLGSDYIERNLGEDIPDDDESRPTIPGGHVLKLDTSYYTPYNKVIIDNFTQRDTSTYMESNGRVWNSLWIQSAIKNAIIKNSRFDSNVVLSGKGDFDPTGQSWSFRQTVDNCEFSENGFVTLCYGVRMSNCKFTRVIPTKNADGSANANSVVDYPYPNYTDLKLGVFWGGTNIEEDTTLYGSGDRFDYNIIEKCTFTAREFYTQITNNKTKFYDCIFEEGSKLYPCTNTINQNFDLQFYNCKRMVIAFVGTPDISKKSGAFVHFDNSEIIITGYSGVSDLTNSSSSIRRLFDGANYSWNNLKIYNTSNTLLHDLKGFTWLKEPTSSTEYGIEGATYETSNHTYLYTSGAWIKKQKEKVISSTFSGDGVITTFEYTHNLFSTPLVMAIPASSDAEGIKYVTSDSTKIYVHYDVAPPVGTNNVTINYIIN